MPSLLSDFDLYLLAEGTHLRSFERLGSHLVSLGGVDGVNFVVWAPHAESVSVVGDFNDWDPQRDPMERRGWSGLWERFVPGVPSGSRYKYRIRSRLGGEPFDKADPHAFAAETPPLTASRVWALGGHEWGDRAWLTHRAEVNALGAPISIHEVHLGSWRRVPEQGNRSLSYREAAPLLADHAHEMGYTHVELLPLMEYPFAGSWGYQPTGYFAPTSRYGTPRDLMFLIDTLHQRGLGVILDWVPAHFPDDPHGLAMFDGEPLYEYRNPEKGRNPEWNTHVFDYKKPEVRNFLISSALYWLEHYHVDGFRVDAVTSMLLLDQGRADGEWTPNRLGGRENLEAIAFLQQFNETVHQAHPGILTIAEETSGHPGVTRPVSEGGLGFDLRWDVGWVHDTVNEFMTHPARERKAVFGNLLKRRTYAGEERYVLPYSHDEVKAGLGSLLAKMPGDDWQKRANLRLTLGYQYALTGKKLLFMGTDFAQCREWDHDGSLDWHLLDDPRHDSIRRWVRDLNTTYRGVPALHERDCLGEGIRWVETDDAERCVLAFTRHAEHSRDVVLVACNFTPTPRHNYRLGVPHEGTWDELLNSDARLYGGSGQGNIGGLSTTPIRSHGQRNSLVLVLPPLSMVMFRSRSGHGG